MRDFAEQGNSKCWSLIGYLALLAPLEFLELAALLHFWRLAGLRILRIRHQQFHMCEKNVVGCNLLKLIGNSGMCRYSGHRRYETHGGQRHVPLQRPSLLRSQSYTSNSCYSG